MTSLKSLTLLGLFLLLFAGMTAAQDRYEMVVAADGTGDFTTIQAAIDATKAFPDKRITIFIKNGVYREKVRVYSWNTLLTLKGESAEKTIITWDDHFSKINLGRNSTFHTYTLKVEANDFIAENLTIENTAGPVGQAVALHVEGDRCQFRNCRMTGHQDTLYTAGEGRRQYFKDCFIEGTTDFIFGEATVLFDNCIINSKSNSYVTAASTPQGMPFGYVFLNCRLTADEGVDKAYLGRPWRDFAKVVFIRCEIGPHILPQGWANWSKTDRDRTAFYAEYENTGPGANPSQRVVWSRQLTKKEAKRYTAETIFNAGQNTISTNDNWWKE
ncbi:pectinesterase family protein [Gaoshiqia sediminis]|uniref:Pectinesterase n=1 Tax=Gaoshiqia sediminis TaxID=2986998 RepID=A0AA42C8T4_9BACT|nr:pectinesterase family protein [Gaoshiqia sediminis]MCW0481250.1 pectinesterase family protein [Gaoshiqia sediminis]